MSSNLLDQLKQIDPALLTDYVRQDKGSHSFEILEWTVAPMSHAKIIRTTGGLFRFSGQGLDNGVIKPWSIVLKVLKDPHDRCQKQDEWCYWKREPLAFKSGTLANLPKAIIIPLCYGVTEHKDSGWIWMEEIVSDADKHW
jgi:hypothetical protein